MITRSVPKVMRMIFLRNSEGPGKESGGRGRWRGNPGIQFDLPQLGPRLCSSQYVSKVCSSFCVLSWAKMQRSLEQHYAMKLCVKLGKSGSETLQLLRTAYGDAVLSSVQVLRWHKAFKDGRESIEDEQCAGHPSTSRTENNVARLKAVLDRVQRLSVRLIAEEVGLLKTDIHQIIMEDLHMSKICAKLVPKNLSDEHCYEEWQQRWNCCRIAGVKPIFCIFISYSVPAHISESNCMWYCFS